MIAISQGLSLLVCLSNLKFKPSLSIRKSVEEQAHQDNKSSNHLITIWVLASKQRDNCSKRKHGTEL